MAAVGKWTLLVIFTGAAILSASNDFSGISYLDRRADAIQLIVDDKPFLILGGELNNSSASSLEYLQPIWSELVQMNLNTVLVPVYWELIEPQQGEFDFSLVDGLIDAARQHRLRLIFLWFGSWKNSMSCYVPGWVKTDQQRFPRARLKDGRAKEILSAFYASNCEADARAFAALMAHIREIDSVAHTVIMIQVENEVGMIGDARDYCDAANSAFEQKVPAELINYLVEHKDRLDYRLYELWARNNFKQKGLWSEVFGEDLAAEEVFMAWHYAKYVDRIAAAGKAEYPLPMFVNAALNRPWHRPGQYPSAGPLPHLIDIWRAGAPHIDFLSPDIYFDDFEHWASQYHRDNNPLFIPEARADLSCIAKAFCAIGEYKAMGFSPFGIDGLDDEIERLLSAGYKVLSSLSELIPQAQAKGSIRGVLLDEKVNSKQIEMAGYLINISHQYLHSIYGTQRPSPWPVAGGLIISTSPDEFVAAGTGLVIKFSLQKPGVQTGILSIDEGQFEGTRWVSKRRLNGDQSHQGRQLHLPLGSFSIQRIKLYYYH